MTQRWYCMTCSAPAAAPPAEWKCPQCEVSRRTTEPPAEDALTGFDPPENCPACSKPLQTGMYVNPAGCFCGVRTVGYNGPPPPNSLHYRMPERPIVTDAEPVDGWPGWLIWLATFLACAAFFVWSLATFRLGFNLGFLIGYLTP
jgi:hypothetical protein